MGWIHRWRRAGGRSGRFSARLFPLPRGWLTPLDSSGGRMEYSEIPTAATALRFCARGHLLPHVAVHGRSWLLVAVGGRSCCSSSALALPGCDGFVCTTQAFATRSEAAGWLAMVSGWGALIAGCPACRLVGSSGERGNQKQVEGAAVAGIAWQSVGVRRREPSIRIIVSTSRSGSPRSA